MVLGTFQFKVNPSRIHLPDLNIPQCKHLLPSRISLGTGMGNHPQVVVGVGPVWILVPRDPGGVCPGLSPILPHPFGCGASRAGTELQIWEWLIIYHY